MYNYLMQQVIEQITTMQQLMAGEQSLTPQQQVVAALHSLNAQHKLQCLDEKDENLEFPEKWRDHPDGSYCFRYRNLARGTVVKFKLTVEDKYVVVIFGEEGSKESFRVTINSIEPLEAIVKQYTFTLKQYLGKDSFSGPSMESKPMPMPVSQPEVRRGTAMVGHQMVQPVYPPKNLVN